MARQNNQYLVTMKNGETTTVNASTIGQAKDRVYPLRDQVAGIQRVYAKKRCVVQGVTGKFHKI